MDEGFAEYYGELAASKIIENYDLKKIIKRNYEIYANYAKSGTEQPQTTQADRFNYDRSYSISAYYKGFVFLSQLGYIIGEENQKKAIKKYFEDFKFKHPVPNDIIRSAEKVSGLELDWYLTDWTQTTNTIDYAVQSVKDQTVTLERIGLM